MLDDTIAWCWGCGGPLLESDFNRKGCCSQCDRDTRVCLNCFFYDPDYHNDCREVLAEPVVDKERANFCDSFHPKQMETTNKSLASAPGNDRQSLWNAAESLFKMK